MNTPLFLPQFMPYRKQTRAEPDHVNIYITNYNTLTFMKIDESTKKRTRFSRIVKNLADNLDM